MMIVRPSLLIIANAIRKRVRTDRISVAKLLRIKRCAVDDVEVERRDHVHALSLVDFLALNGYGIDLHGMGLMHSAQFRECVRVLIRQRDSGLRRKWLAKSFYRSLFPGTAEDKSRHRQSCGVYCRAELAHERRANCPRQRPDELAATEPRRFRQCYSQRSARSFQIESMSVTAHWIASSA